MALVMSHPAPKQRGAELSRVRSQARLLLGDLLVCRADSEERLETLGTRDPLKAMTGHSALDNAVQRTREMIDRLDELDMPPAVIVETKLNGAGVALAR